MFAMKSVVGFVFVAMVLTTSGCDDDGGTDTGDGGSAMGGDMMAMGGATTGGTPAMGGMPMGGATPGMGGMGAGGVEPGTGGAEPGTGGAEPGTGGAEPGTGGAEPGAGGVAPGMGGADPGMGGAAAGVYLDPVEGCPQRAGFFDLANGDNFIDYNEDGRTNADVFDNAALAPRLTVECADGTVSVASNGVVNYDYYFVGRDGNGGNLNSPQSRAPEVAEFTYVFPMAPEMAAASTAIPAGGAAGVLSNGIQLYGPNEALPDNGADPYLHGLLGYCGGHTTYYHHHSFPECFFEFPTIGGAPSLLPQNAAGVTLGYAFDGFPILAPYECTDAACDTVLPVQSSWDYDTNAMWTIERLGLSGDCQTDDEGGYSDNYVWDCNVFNGQKGDTADTLFADECNGRVRPDGSYAYYATRAFPYFLGCYRGTPSESVGRGVGPMGPG